VWTLDALVQAAHELGIAIERSQVRRILLEEGALAAPALLDGM
jgi:transposase